MKISGPGDIYYYLTSYSRKRQEHFFVLTLNGCHEVIKRRIITIGIVNRTIVHPREIFYEAIRDNAVAIVVAHNHPSGSLEPSPEDVEITKRLIQAGNVLGIPILDHIIFGKQKYLSFVEKGFVSFDLEYSESLND